MRDAAARERVDRIRQRKMADQSAARIRAQIAALEAELAAQRLESELLAERDDDEQRRRGWEHAELLRLRHADSDTQLNDGPQPSQAAHARAGAGGASH